ncbi:MAG: hypothetical protein ACRCUJ_01640 [Phocaeicola sp.]
MITEVSEIITSCVLDHIQNVKSIQQRIELLTEVEEVLSTVQRRKQELDWEDSGAQEYTTEELELMCNEEALPILVLSMKRIKGYELSDQAEGIGITRDHLNRAIKLDKNNLFNK